MRLGIRVKLIATLVFAGLLPLALALAAALFAAHEVTQRFVGLSFAATAHQQAKHLATLLSSQIDFVNAINHLPMILQFMEQAAQRPPSSPEEIQQIEARWPTLPPDDPLLKNVLENTVAQRWRIFQNQQPRIAEVLVTDPTGRLVAATNRTTDYFQADEEWWQQSWDQGRGRIVVQEVRFDPSAVSPTGQVGLNVIDLCLPIVSDGQGPPLGIIKVSLALDWFLRQLHDVPLEQSNDLYRAIWLIRNDGQPITAMGRKLPFAQLPPSLLKDLHSGRSGYTVDSDLAGYEVIGYAPVKIRPESKVLSAESKAPLPTPHPALRTQDSALGTQDSALSTQDSALSTQHSGLRTIGMAQWHVLVAAPSQEALASTRLIPWAIGLVGAVVIGLCFFVGLWVAQREIIRPVFTLEREARNLEEGHLDSRLAPPGTPGTVFRDDELGRLAREFNRMAEELEHNIAELEHADQLKRQFIDVASHELRTPVTYILGATELAQRQGEAGPELLAKVHAKALRLQRIVENMFKLLQSESYEAVLRLRSVDVKKLVEQATRELEPFSQPRKQKVLARMPEPPVLICGDAEKLRDVLDNLLSNAIRFSPDEATIEVDVVDQGPTVELSVTDQGPGLKSEQLQHLFQPFATEHEDLIHHTSGELRHMSRGMGLGLSVVKRFVEMHGGTVSAEMLGTEATPPEERRGLRVRVVLPKEPPPKDSNGEPVKATDERRAGEHWRQAAFGGSR